MTVADSRVVIPNPQLIFDKRHIGPDKVSETVLHFFILSLVSKFEARSESLRTEIAALVTEDFGLLMYLLGHLTA